MDGYEFDRAFAVGQSLQDEVSLPGLIDSKSSHTLKIIAGVDEVGRGPLAGPVVAAAVILPLFPRIKGLNDSKLLTPEKRESLCLEIRSVALAKAVGIVAPNVIDSINILAASLLAMRQAIQKLRMTPGMVLVDGNQKPRSGLPETTIVKGDQKSAAIMAASILAKVTRDAIMVKLHEQYPQYSFQEHKGYACPRHLEALEKHGPSPVHRFSFDPVKSMAQISF